MSSSVTKTDKPAQIHDSPWRRLAALKRSAKALIILMSLLIFIALQAYCIGLWYQKRHASEPLHIGVTFIADYARYYGLDPNETMLALRDDLGFRDFRLVSYWKNIEQTPGHYDFSELDWQFKKVNEVGGRVTLSIGLRQPRWPECHAPNWVQAENKDQWQPQLKAYMQAVIERYKDNPALSSYQLENEYFLGAFGECRQFGADRDRLIDEFNLVKSLDSNTPIILSYANNYFGVATGQPRPDQIGVSIYKRVWNPATKRYFEYPFPSWYYSWRAGLQELITGKTSMVHELQAEPWVRGGNTVTASLSEQDRTMNSSRLSERIDYGVDTGMRDIYLWGGEWWYWRKVVHDDPSLWETVRTKMTEYGQIN